MTLAYPLMKSPLRFLPSITNPPRYVEDLRMFELLTPPRLPLRPGSPFALDPIYLKSSLI